MFWRPLCVIPKSVTNLRPKVVRVILLEEGSACLLGSLEWSGQIQIKKVPTLRQA